jgi:hypothetical protein
MAVTWGGAELRLLEATLIPGFVAMVAASSIVDFK